MPKIVALIALVIFVVGIAHYIEITARPPSQHVGKHIEGGHE